MTSDRIQERLTTQLGLDPEALSRVGLAGAVLRRMRALDLETEEAYADRLDVDLAEFERLAMAVMVHETSFFRYPGSFDLLVGEARTRLASVTGSGAPFRVHCVASSTGEEPSSVVMALMEAGVDLHRVQVDATDVSERAVHYARRGHYRLRGVNRVPEALRTRWFEARGDEFELSPEIRGHIHYSRANALDATFGLGQAPYDAILCRNLMIYLVPEARRRLLRRLREMLRPGGLLFVGHAEIAAVRAAGLALASPPEAFACRLVVPAPDPARRAAGRATETSRAVPPRSASPRSAPPGSATSSAPRRRPAPAPLPAAVDAQAVLARAARLADAGDLQQARRALLDGIAEGPVIADHYHLLALVESAQGQDRDSEEALRRALYLDPHHYPSLMQLALLAETRGDRGRARRLREKAARVKGDVRDD